MTEERSGSEADAAWRSHRVGQLDESLVDQGLRLAGFVETIREHKHQVFIHLRDATGRLQIVVDETRAAEIYAEARNLTAESIIQVEGMLRRRPEGKDRTQLDSRTIEFEVERMVVLFRSPPLPFPVREEGRDRIDERLRLEHRYLELRSPGLTDSLRQRSSIVSGLRRALEERDFLEVETPVLMRQSPEGAREFLVPSRQEPGSAYALAQSPQLFKQLLMMGGCDRYYQVARCFRDEDGRANRQPEFTQLDLECSWAVEADIREAIEGAVTAAATAIGRTLEGPFPILSWQEAIDRYGVDRPDLRFGTRLVDATDLLSETGFKKLRQTLDRGGLAGLFALEAAEVGELSNAELDRVREEAISLGAPGLLWFRREGTILKSDAFVERILTEAERTALAERLPGAEGDAVFLLVAAADRLPSVFGALRSRLARRYDLAGVDDLKACWVSRFPFFDPATLTPSHHPFTSPVDAERFESEIGSALGSAKAPDAELLQRLAAWPSHAYDLVINGEEIGSGSIRVHDANLQRLIFRLLGYTDDEVEQRFGFFVRALERGAPPHGGIALGIDRLVMVLTGRDALRDVIAFPKSTDHSDPMMGAPAPVPAELLSFGHKSEKG